MSPSPVAPGTARSLRGRRGSARPRFPTNTLTPPRWRRPVQRPPRHRPGRDDAAPGRGATRRCASMRARSAAGASTPSAALRVSATARCCSASRSASSGDAATRASSAARRSGASDPSASAASSAISVAGLVCSTTSHRHSTTKGSSERACVAPRLGRPALEEHGALAQEASSPVHTPEPRSRRAAGRDQVNSAVRPSRSEGHRFGRR